MAMVEMVFMWREGASKQACVCRARACDEDEVPPQGEHHEVEEHEHQQGQRHRRGGLHAAAQLALAVCRVRVRVARSLLKETTVGVCVSLRTADCEYFRVLTPA